MHVRWAAVLTGFVVDYLISALVFALANPDPQFLVVPDPRRPGDLFLIGLGLFCTGVGGYVAGRIAQVDRALNGFLVGVVGILIWQLAITAGPAPSRVFVVANAIACGVAALGGLLSRYPRQPQPHSSGRP